LASPITFMFRKDAVGEAERVAIIARPGSR
jgi:hypothetical protein